MGLSSRKSCRADNKTYKGISQYQPGIKTGQKKIIIPEDIQRQLDVLPPRSSGRKRTPFLDWQDEAIKQYGPVCSLTKISKIVGRSTPQVLRRYKELMGGK